MSLPFNVPNETSKLIVIPQEMDLAGRILQLRKTQVKFPSPAMVYQTDSKANVLVIRRQALRNFGHSIRKAAQPVHVTTSSFAEVSAMAESLVKKVMGGQATHEALLDLQGTTAADEPGLKVLEALGAVIVDADSVDQDELQSSHALVLPNVAIPLVGTITPPAPAPAAAVNPNAWHLRQTHADVKRQEGLIGTGITVGVLDTGIDATHPEFAGKSILFQEFDPQGNLLGNVPRDSGQHGTHVSGLIAGQQAGTAPGASLAVAAVLTSVGADGENYGYLAQILAGLNWLLTTSVRNEPPVYIINGSFGGSGYNNYLYSTLQTALIAPGALFIAAIGNNGFYGINQHGSPGNYDIVIGVGATDKSNNVCLFSDWGIQGTAAKPDLCAPGDDIWSSLPGGAYGLLSGTSMASPQVAATAALLLQKNPLLVGDAQTLSLELRKLVQAVSSSTTARGGLGTLDLTLL